MLYRVGFCTSLKLSKKCSSWTVGTCKEEKDIKSTNLTISKGKIFLTQGIPSILHGKYREFNSSICHRVTDIISVKIITFFNFKIDESNPTNLDKERLNHCENEEIKSIKLERIYQVGK